MMNIDGARAADPVVKKAPLTDPNPLVKSKPHKKDGENVSPGPTEPVFSSEEKKLNIEVPEGWHIG